MGIMTISAAPHRVGQIVSWEDPAGMHYGRVVYFSLNGTMAFIHDVNTFQDHRVSTERLTLVGDAPGGDAEAAGTAPALVDLPIRADIQLADIVPSRWQPRAPRFDAGKLLELATSIQELGLINPITVFATANTDEGGRGYELVAGERRVRASIAIAMAKATGTTIQDSEWVAVLAAEGITGLGKDIATLWASGATIAATIEYPDLARMHKLAVMENIERESLSPIEEARAFQGLMDAYGWSGRRLAQELGKSQGYISQRLQLLGLPEAAQIAVDREEIGIAGARAIAAAPEPIRGALTAWALEDRDTQHGGPTTRQIEERAREVGTILDHNHWMPNTAQAIEPERRNRMAMVRWLLESARTDRRGAAIINLSRSISNNPRQAVNSHWNMQEIITALLGHPESYDQCYERFALATGRTCETCLLRRDDEIGHGTDPYCDKWAGLKSGWLACDHWIGDPDPVAIPAGWRLGINIEKRFPMALHADWGWYFDSVWVYAEAVAAEVADLEAHREHEEVAADEAFFDDMRMYLAFQALLSDDDRAHAQAHVCERCVYYLPLLAAAGGVPCHFATYPLRRTYGDKLPRAPEYGLLCRQDGTCLPRCERFRLARGPFVEMSHGVYLPDADQAVRWIGELLANQRSSYDRHWLWGVLSWLPYPRDDDHKTDLASLRKWLVANWETIDSAGFATLMDVAISEIAARQEYKSGTVFGLLNPQTTETETWIDMHFEGLRVQSKRPDPTKSCVGWTLPWERVGARVTILSTDADPVTNGVATVVGRGEDGHCVVESDDGTRWTYPSNRVQLYIPRDQEA